MNRSAGAAFRPGGQWFMWLSSKLHTRGPATAVKSKAELVAYKHHLQTSRFELKYLVDENRAWAIREFVRCHLEPDKYTRSQSDIGYAVCSLYLDTRALALYRQTVRGLKNRFKLRIRFYDDAPESPAFIEIKRRIVNVIRKERVAITREGVERLLCGGWPDELEIAEGESSAAVHHFCGLRDRIGADPSVYVSFLREAYVSPGSDRFRITLDREVKGSHYRPGSPMSWPTRQVKSSIDRVILELKFTDRFASWMHDMVRTFNLERCSVPKYVHSIEAVRLSGSYRREIETRIA